MSDRFILKISCPDSQGNVAAVYAFLADAGSYVTEAAQHADPSTGLLFMRVAFRRHTAAMPDADGLRRAFAPVAERFGMDFTLVDADCRPRAIIAVSRFDHCLNDLLHRARSGELAIDIPAVVSNHPDMRRLVEWHDIPYHHLPVTGENRPEQERRILDLMAECRADLLVLARYMQVLGNDTCAALAGRAINIHHSFLPSFKGAHPYRQAHAAGVKLIGATAHYVTPDLDEGPIIEQEAIRVDHSFSADAMVAAGRDVESQVLARAVRWHCEQRVFLNGRRTVVFR